MHQTHIWQQIKIDAASATYTTTVIATNTDTTTATSVDTIRVTVIY